MVVCVLISQNAADNDKRRRLAQYGGTNSLYKPPSSYLSVSLKHDGTDGSDGTDGTGIQSVSPVPSASAAGPSVPSVSNSRSN